MAKFIHVEGNKVKAANKKLMTLINKDKELKKEFEEIKTFEAREKKKRDQKHKKNKKKKGG